MKAIGLIVLGGVLCLQSGCLSNGYRATAKPRPAVALDLAGKAAEAEATVQSVIVFNGPGAWKRDAYWDEYVITIVNRGRTPLTIAGASLRAEGQALAAAGADPWKLENESKTWWEKVKSNQGAKLVTLGVGGVVASGGLVVAAIAADGGIMAAATTGGTILAGAAAATLVATPIYAATIIYSNHRNKQTATAEYVRRRIALPLRVEPGQTLSGSLFFRIMPSPERLVLSGNSGGAPVEIEVGLGALAGLHLR